MNMTIQEVITEVSMTYSYKMHLAVEGNDDCRFFKSALRGADNINMLCLCGSDNVVALVHEVDKIKANHDFPPLLGVIDIDYRVPLGTLPKSPNLITSDDRDLECMMFNSPSFGSVLSEFGSEEKVAKIGGLAVVASAAQAAAKIIGYVRFHAQKEKIATTFQSLDISRLIDKRSLSINPEELVSHLNSRQGVTGCRLPEKVFDAARATCRDALCEKGLPYFKHDLLLCRGHDLMEILAIGCRSLLGSRSATESSRENVESMFRLSYIAHFRATSMAKSFENWLATNAIGNSVSLT